MKLSQVAFNWEALGRRDAYGAILTERAKEDGPWKAPEFFENGAAEWRRIRARAKELGLTTAGATALDFGCGVGRIARHLLEDFEAVDGVDVANTMVEAARALHPAHEADYARLRFLQNDREDLDLLEDGRYDLVHSLITLQHLPPHLARGYIGEFFRKARPGGTIFFQLPAQSHASSARLLTSRSWKQRLLAVLPARVLESYRLARTGRPRMDMFGVERDEVEALIRSSGGELVAADAFDDTGGLLPSLRYFARRS